jgi:hypothetical protein
MAVLLSVTRVEKKSKIRWSVVIFLIINTSPVIKRKSNISDTNTVLKIHAEAISGSGWFTFLDFADCYLISDEIRKKD